jgi:hypothetical protein
VTVDLEALRAEVAASRAVQGLPPTITDPETIAAAAALLADVLVEGRAAPNADDVKAATDG